MDNLKITHTVLNQDKYIETPDKLNEFFNDIQQVCSKHGFSISTGEPNIPFTIDKYEENADHPGSENKMDFNIYKLRCARIQDISVLE